MAYGLWSWLALGAEAVSIREQARRIALMCDAYGLDDRRTLTAELAQRQRETLAQHIRVGWDDRVPIVAAEIDWWQMHAADLLG